MMLNHIVIIVLRSNIIFSIVIVLSSLLLAQDTVHVDANLFGQYKELPILGGNLKPSIQPSWNQTDFLEHLSTLQPQTLRWPGAEAANYFDWNKGTLMPCYKWTGVSYPFDHPDRDLCGQQNDLCTVDGSGVGSVQYPRSIQSELMDDTQRSANYVDNYASNYINALKTLREDLDNKPLIPFFTLNVLSPEYHDPDSVIFDANCDVISNPVNTISQQLDSIAVLTAGMDEIYIQLGNEPWYAKPYKETIWPNASAYFLNMITIADSIASHPGLQHAKVSLFADVHSDDIEDDDCINNNTSLRCAWNDSMHTILSTGSAYNLFDAYSIHKYTGLKNIQIPELDENCNPIANNWIDYLIEDIPSFNECQMNYLIKWMIITRDQMFENFAGNNQYPGLYNSINGNSSPKDIWITEYDMGLDANDAFDKPYSNGWSHAIYNLYTTLKYIIEVPDIGVLIQNNILGYSGGYRLIDTYSYVDDEGTNNAKYHIYFDEEGNEYRKLVSHTFTGLSPKGEAIRLLNELAWRNSSVAPINFDSSTVDSTEVRSISEISYYAKNLYGWVFDEGDFIFMNISNDTINILLESDHVGCSAYNFTIMEGDLYARNYQTEFGSSLAYDTLSHNQVAIWEFDSSIQFNHEQDYFAASYAMHISTGSVKDYHPTFNIPPHSVIQILKDNTFNENACDCAGNIEDCTGECGGTAVLDECGVCGGSGIAEGECDCDGNVLDCSGECGATAVVDECGICAGGTTSLVISTFTDQDTLLYTGAYDCSGECGGTAEVDECGECGGDGTSCLSLYFGLIPDEFSIHNIYPNPFNPRVNITYALPENIHVKFDIFDISGRQVQSLVNEYKTAGYHSATWYADNQGSGLYICRLSFGNQTITQKMLLMK